MGILFSFCSNFQLESSSSKFRFFSAIQAIELQPLNYSEAFEPEAKAFATLHRAVGGSSCEHFAKSSKRFQASQSGHQFQPSNS